VAETIENKTSFLRKLGNEAGVEMSFVDHLEALRWHLVEPYLWLVAVIAPLRRLMVFIVFTHLQINVSYRAL
jgi:hypothetical protein